MVPYQQENSKRLSKLGLPVDSAEVRKLIRKLDRDHDGLIDYKEFLDVLSSEKAISKKSTRKVDGRDA